MAHNYLRQDQLFHRVLHLPVALAGVSDAVQSILAQQFGRSSLLIPNGVDCDRFFPGPPSDVLPSAILSSPTKTQVRHLLLEGQVARYCRMFHTMQVSILPWGAGSDTAPYYHPGMRCHKTNRPAMRLGVRPSLNL